MNRKPKWYGLDLDDERNRRLCRMSLRRTSQIVTPYWNSGFIDWLIYGGTIFPRGLKVKSVTSNYCMFAADAAGVQPEGICLNAVFRVETAKFTRSELKQMVHDFEFSASSKRLSDLFPTKAIVRLEWHYDGAYDDAED